MIEELTDEHGILLRRNAVANHVDDNALARLTRSGTLTKLRHGAYCLTDVWQDLNGRGRHRVLIYAVLQQYDGSVAASHSSAALLHGAPDFGLPHREVEVTSLIGAGGRRLASVRHHRGVIRVNDVTRGEGHWVTSPVRTALDVAPTMCQEAAVVLLDDFVHRGLTSKAELLAGHETRVRHPHSLGLHRRIRLCAEGSESVGETRTRLLIAGAALPTPVLQYSIYDGRGEFVGRVDMAWPEYRLMLEFDGRIKYGRLLRRGESPGDAVFREKQREDRLREVTGWRMIRLTWADLERAQHTAKRIADGLRAVA